MNAAVVLAHQGGWDEMLMVAVPVVVFGALLWVANRRAGSLEGSGEQSAQSAEAAQSADEQNGPPV